MDELRTVEITNSDVEAVAREMALADGIDPDFPVVHGPPHELRAMGGRYVGVLGAVFPIWQAYVGPARIAMAAAGRPAGVTFVIVERVSTELR